MKWDVGFRLNVYNYIRSTGFQALMSAGLWPALMTADFLVRMLAFALIFIMTIIKESMY
jgi:hypothetical protein